jgi:bacillithiol system protein YtxJ
MNWHALSSIQQLDAITERSRSVPCLIFKHSTRCSISFMAKYRLETDWDLLAEEIEPYYLDLIAHRDISNEIAQRYAVHHESPQILLIKNGECELEASHLDITVEEIKEVLFSLSLM